MKEIEKIAEDLFDKIRSRFDDVTLGDEAAKATTEPDKARFFNFDYSVEGNNYGNVTVSIADNNSLKVYFSRNITDGMSDEDRPAWYDFLKSIRFFAKRNMMTFDTRDISRNNLTNRDVSAIGKTDSSYDSTDVVAESAMYGSSKSSYQKMGPVRLVVRHSKKVDENSRGSRTRNIASVFVETAEGERFKLPFAHLNGARAMARHIQMGGSMNDTIGEHITGMVEEMDNLRVFVRNMRGRTFEDTETGDMVSSAIDYYGSLQNNLHKLKGTRSYKNYVESYQPSELELDFNEDEMRERFTRKLFDDRMTSALSSVYKAYTMRQQEVPETSMGSEFESWINGVSENDSMDAEDDNSLRGLFATELQLGPDGTNAIGALQGILGDDDLYNELADLAQADPEGDARPSIINWLEDNDPDLARELLSVEQQPTSDDEVDEEVNKYDKVSDFIDDVEFDADEKSDEEEDLELEFLKRLSGL